MQAGNRSRIRVLLVALVALVGLALPAAASASVATSGTGSHLQRSSWISYIGAFGGSVTAISPGTYNATTRTLTTAFNSGTTYDITSASAGSGTLSLSGGLTYTVPSHYIWIEVKDLRVAITSPRAAAAVVTASVNYDPYETSGPQVDNRTGFRDIDIYTVDLSTAFRGASSRHTWTAAVARLTAAGALAFNGGINGSYRAGDLFGSFDLSATR